MSDAGQAVEDGGTCQIGTPVLNVKMTVTQGNLLIIFDQSMSMQEVWMSSTKLMAAREALVQAITPLQSELTVGAIFLPDPAIACIADNPQTTSAVQPIEGAGNIPFQPGPAFLAAFNAHWSMQGTGMGIGTPLNEAFDRANVALEAALPNLQGSVAVLVFTDGQPNCTPNPAVTGIPTETEPQRASDWFVQNVPTYMVGLPGAMDGAKLLDDIASGGSGGRAPKYISPADPMALEAKLDQVVQRQVSTGLDSCSIDLIAPVAEPDTLQLVVDQVATKGQSKQVPHDLGNGSGWTISSDGSRVELLGALCDRAMGGEFSRITFWSGCQMLPTLPPVPLSP